MLARAALLVAATLVLGVWSAMAQFTYQSGSRHPDESATETYNERLSLQNALTSTKQIGKALDSFTKLTKLARPKLTDAQMRQVGNTEPDMQELGFRNWVGAVEGTLRKQNYEIAKLQLDLARLQAKAGKLSPKVVKQRQDACRKAEQDFQKFWRSFGVAD